MESQDKKLANTLQLTFLGFLSVSFIGYFALHENWIGFIFAHIAAICIMGFFGCMSAAIAQKKGYSYKKNFLVGFCVPLVLGVISAFILVPYYGATSPITCGGWVVLGSGIGVIVAYLLVRWKR